MTPLSHGQLAPALAALTPPPLDAGLVRRVVQRGRDEKRTLPGRVELSVERGVLGDKWSTGRAPKREAQVTVMRFDVASLLCQGHEVAVLGDNLFVDLDTSAANLPPGTEVRVGAARCRVTPKPHTGCAKFAARVGADALAITRSAQWLHHQLRGVHLEVLEGGVVAEGDRLVVVRRGMAS